MPNICFMATERRLLTMKENLNVSRSVLNDSTMSAILSLIFNSVSSMICSISTLRISLVSPVWGGVGEEYLSKTIQFTHNYLLLYRFRKSVIVSSSVPSLPAT